MLSKEMVRVGSRQSCIRELFEYGLAQAKKIGADNVFDYSLGNPSIPAPPEVNAAIEELIRHEDSRSIHGYTPARGDEETRAAVAADLNARYGTAIGPHNLFITCGAAPAVVAAIRALAVEGSEILGITPYFTEYRMFVEGCGARFVAAPADRERFQIDTQALEGCLTPHTQAVIVNSPNNPSGVVYTRETLTELARVLRKKSAEYGRPIYIIADEPYRELVYDGAEATFIPTVYADTIVCYSYSKSLSLPGERIGYLCVADEAEDSRHLMTAIAGAARSSGHVCAPSLMQRVIARCAQVRPDIRAYDRNRLKLYHALTDYGYRCVKPDGAFYLFIQAPGDDAQAFSDLAKAYNLLLVPGGDFGCPDYFRISTCVSYDMIERSLPVFQELLLAWEQGRK